MCIRDSAYTAAANAVLAAAKQVTVQVCVRGVLRVEYPLYELAQRLLADAGARLEEVQFADRVTPVSYTHLFILRMSAFCCSMMILA